MLEFSDEGGPKGGGGNGNRDATELKRADDESITGVNFEQMIAIVGFPLHVHSSQVSL